jgi:hypothetical protein
MGTLRITFRSRQWQKNLKEMCDESRDLLGLWEEDMEDQSFWSNGICKDHLTHISMDRAEVYM